jgi:NADPH:quinone reductase-like Zn-dependent oxidoreductase
MSRAIVAPEYGEPSVLEFVEVEVAEPQEGEVTIAVRAAGVNPADLKQLRGVYGRNEASLPLRLGSEVAGVVTAVGPDAIGPLGPIAVGDEVVGFRVSGGYAEALTVKASAVLPKPSSLGWEQAAGLLATAVTAFHLLEATGVTAGDRVLVHGASGGVGLIAVQLAKLRGAEVVGTASAANQDLVRRHGAQPVVYGPGLADRVRAIFPQGVDVALDTVGTDEAVDGSAELVADHARVGTIAAFVRGGELGFKLLGSGPGADPGSAIRMSARAELLELAGAGKLEVLVGRTFPLAEAAAALELIGSGHPGGKVILLP